MTRLTLGFEERDWVGGGGVCDEPQYSGGYDVQYLYGLQRDYVEGGSEVGGMLDPDAGRDY